MLLVLEFIRGNLVYRGLLENGKKWKKRPLWMAPNLTVFFHISGLTFHFHSDQLVCVLPTGVRGNTTDITGGTSIRKISYICHDSCLT